MPDITCRMVCNQNPLSNSRSSWYSLCLQIDYLPAVRDWHDNGIFCAHGDMAGFCSGCILCEAPLLQLDRSNPSSLIMTSVAWTDIPRKYAQLRTHNLYPNSPIKTVIALSNLSSLGSRLTCFASIPIDQRLPACADHVQLSETSVIDQPLRMRQRNRSSGNRPQDQEDDDASLTALLVSAAVSQCC